MKWTLLLLLVVAVPARAQDFTYRGFVELQPAIYPQTTPRDDDRLAADARLRFEPAFKATDWLTLAASTEARVDNLEQVEREWRVDVRDRGLKRPALTLRQAQASVRKGPVTVDVGKQFIRWGKADILNPTDRFAPRDFLEVTDDEFLGVTGVRAIYDRGSSSLDLVWVPLFTPSRVPLAERRWAGSPPETLAGLPVVDRGAAFPARSQYGARWNVLAPAFEMSLSYFDGFSHLPQFTATFLSSAPLIAVQRTYSPIRMVGVDAAVPLRWATLKGEAGSFVARDGAPQTDDVVLYVVQLERQSGELSLVGGYAGEIVRKRRTTFDFAPDRGLTRAFLGRAGYTISTTRDVAFEAAVRQNLDGVWVKGQYSQARGGHWRLTLAATLIAGAVGDFIGQYHRNSHVLITLRYSF